MFAVYIHMYNVHCTIQIGAFHHNAHHSMQPYTHAIHTQSLGKKQVLCERKLTYIVELYYQFSCIVFFIVKVIYVVTYISSSTVYLKRACADSFVSCPLFLSPLEKKRNVFIVDFKKKKGLGKKIPWLASNCSCCFYAPWFEWKVIDRYESQIFRKPHPQSRPNLPPPPPHPQASPLWLGGKHTLLWEIGGGGPNSDEGTHTVVLQVYCKCTLCMASL